MLAPFRIKFYILPYSDEKKRNLRKLIILRISILAGNFVVKMEQPAALISFYDA